MEVYAFDIKNVENRLYDIMSAFQAFYLSVNGLGHLEQISEDELSGFEYVIKDGIRKTKSLIDGMSPVWFQDSGKIVLLFGEEEQ